jgi:hypothetical protein
MSAHSQSGSRWSNVCSGVYNPATQPGTMPLYDADLETSIKVTCKLAGRSFSALITWTCACPPPISTSERLFVAVIDGGTIVGARPCTRRCTCKVEKSTNKSIKMCPIEMIQINSVLQVQPRRGCIVEINRGQPMWFVL